MSLTFSTASLRSILALSEKRDSLLAEIAKIDAEISIVFAGTSSRKDAKTAPVEKRSGRPTETPAKSTKRAKNGRVKELILAGLKEAGEAGIAVKHLATKLGIKPQNIHVWMHTTGKKNGLTEALGKGVYRLKESLGTTTHQSSLDAPKPKARRKSKTKK